MCMEHFTLTNLTDSMLRNYDHALRLPNADLRDIKSIQNWVDGTGCLARPDTEYLELQHDLMNLTGTLGGAVTQIEIVVENIALRLATQIRKAS